MHWEDWEAWYTVGVIALVCIVLIKTRVPPDGILFGGALLIGLAGIIEPKDVFVGFVNQGTLAIAGLFIIAGAMRETGALDTVGRLIFGSARTETQGFFRMGVPVAALSAFMNNTPVVAMMMPVVSDWCRKHGISPSRFLIPLSFMAILGGTCTLIGTSTNLVIDGLMLDARLADPSLVGPLRELGMFEFAKVGLPFVLIGSLYLFFIGRRLLPDRQDVMEKIESDPREYLAEMQVRSGCRLIGDSVERAGLRHLPGLFLVEITRDDEVISPVTPDEVLHEGDVLTFAGVVATMVDLERIQGLVPVADEGYEERAAERRGKSLCEAVISSRSPLAGKNVRDADFRGTYNAAVIAVHRGAERIAGRIGDIVLRPGDTLLLQTGNRFARAHHNNPDFYLVSTVEEARPVRHDKAMICAGLMVVLVVLMTTRAVDLVLAVFTIAGLMVATRCISASSARKAIDWETVLTIGAAFGLGIALDKSGAALAIADRLVGVAGDTGPRAVLLALYVLTSLFAAFVSSKASAVLMFPIALAAAAALGVDPRPMIMGVVFAAAATFATPLGYPTNLMVYGPGGYRFGDFARVGLPLNLILTVVVTVLVPEFWPF